MTAALAPATPVLTPRAAPGSVWPASTRSSPDGDLTVGGVSLTELAERYGTPVYVIDEGEFRGRARAWRRALPDADVVYTARAFLSRAVVDWAEQEGLGLVVCSAGELELAATRGFPADRIVLHGDATSPRDLRTALRIGVGRIVLDAPGEIARLAAAATGPEPQQVMVRVRTGALPGAGESGFTVADGSALEAVGRVLGQPCLQLVGIHTCLGTSVASPEPYAFAVRRLVSFLAAVRDRYGVTLPELDLGGGFAVPYLPGDPAPAPAAYGRRIEDTLIRACAAHDYPRPRLTVEPGRSLMAPAGVALYRVLSVSRGATGAWVTVDGGMSDNPRPALYGARYAVRMVGRHSDAPARATTVVGRHGETGDVLAESVELPEDLRPGDVLAVPVSGAYQVSMASGYGMTGRPPVVAVAAGRPRLLLRRETFTDQRGRDVGL
ncbi:diaminopimelate decarboxylase [Streptomyces sp. NPDC057638]|uniref:diaminopimelate decarboxylase n=1 Tax=Streptomyces sp. NPDC057638 TaxID=3346190 RepID=UPI0036A4F2D4